MSFIYFYFFHLFIYSFIYLFLFCQYYELTKFASRDSKKYKKIEKIYWFLNSHFIKIDMQSSKKLHLYLILEFSLLKLIHTLQICNNLINVTSILATE